MKRTRPPTTTNKAKKNTNKSATNSPAKAPGKPRAKADKNPAQAIAGAALQKRMAEAKKLEALDSKRPKAQKPKTLSSAAHPQRISGFPDTYIQQISVALDDPDHAMTLEWTGPEAAEQETGPFRT